MRERNEVSFMVEYSDLKSQLIQLSKKIVTRIVGFFGVFFWGWGVEGMTQESCFYWQTVNEVCLSEGYVLKICELQIFRIKMKYCQQFFNLTKVFSAS